MQLETITANKLLIKTNKKVDTSFNFIVVLSRNWDTMFSDGHKGVVAETHNPTYKVADAAQAVKKWAEQGCRGTFK